MILFNGLWHYLHVFLDIFSNNFKLLCLNFKILSIGGLKILYLRDHIVALLHPFINESYFVVYEIGVIFYLFFQKAQSLLLHFEFFLNLFKYPSLKNLWIVSHHFEDELNLFVDVVVALLNVLDMWCVFNNFILDGIDYLLYNFPHSGLHFKPFKLFNCRTSDIFIYLLFLFKQIH